MKKKHSRKVRIFATTRLRLQVILPLKKNERFIKGMALKYHERMTVHIKQSFVDLVDMGYRYATIDKQKGTEVKEGNGSNNWKKRKFQGNKPEQKAEKKGTKEDHFKDVLCYNCQEKGHYSRDCKKTKKSRKLNQGLP